MRAKTKYKLGIWLMVIIVALGVTSAVVVGRLIHESSYSNLTVSYNSTGVQGTAYANLYCGEQVFALTTNGLTNGNQKIAFTGREKKDKSYHLYVPVAKKGDSAEIKEQKQAVFEYVFSNTSATDWKVSLSLIDVQSKNVNMFTNFKANEQITDFSQISTIVSGNDVVNVTVSAGSIVYVYLKIDVENTFSDASFVGNVLWNLEEFK